MANINELHDVLSLSWHPSADNVLLSSGKNGFNLIDVCQAKNYNSYTINGYGQDIVDIKWNNDGSLMTEL